MSCLFYKSLLKSKMLIAIIPRISMIYKYFPFLFLFFLPLNSSYAINPYENITFYQLDNGMQVVLAPSDKAQNFKIKVKVKVGQSVENINNLGVSHLLEHLLFRDGRFEEGQTYLQLIKENGGSINGYTSYYETGYHAKIPYKKSDWLVKQFSKMLFNRDIKHKDIQRAKSSVELEIGEPGWLSEKLNRDIFGSYSLRYFPEPGFFESEFGIKRQYYTDDEQRLSNRKLTYDELIKLYKDYYYPSNMILFVSGNFNPNNMISLIKTEFGKYKKRTGKTVDDDIKPIPNNKPYLRVEQFPFFSPYINIGTKYDNLTPQEIYILYSYLDYLSHRLMKELRNKKGETYSAYVSVLDRFNSGYGTVSFETTHDAFNTNINYVKSLIENETRKNKFQDDAIKEALKLTREQRIELAELDADSMMRHANKYHTFRDKYNTTISPYEAIYTISYSEYKEGLKKIFNPDNSYVSVWMPYKFHKLEPYILYLTFLVLSIIAIKKMYSRTFDETRVAWVRETAHSPLMIIEIITFLIISMFLYSLIISPLDRYIIPSSFYNSLTLFPYYLYNFFTIFIYLLIFMGLLALFPKKIIVENDNLIIKSIALYLRKFKKESIHSIDTISLFRLLISPKIWFNMKFRYYNSDWKIWRKGLLVKTKMGKTYYIGIKDADETKSQLNTLLLENN